MWRVTLIDAAIFREWLTNIGQRSAIARLAHVFCGMYVRYDAVGLVDGDTYSLRAAGVAELSIARDAIVAALERSIIMSIRNGDRKTVATYTLSFLAHKAVTRSGR